MTFCNRLVRTALFAAGALASPVLHAQVTATAPAEPVSATEDKRFDLMGGAAYSHFNPGYAHQVRATNLLGWQGSATGWFSPLLGVEATFRGAYGTYTLPVNVVDFGITATSSNMSEHLFLFGPSFRFYQKPKYTAGLHVLIGGAYGSFDQAFHGSGIQPFAVGVYNNQLAPAFAIGGWADYKATPQFAVRVNADYQPTHYGGQGQNEFVGSVGIVYKVGRRK